MTQSQSPFCNLKIIFLMNQILKWRLRLSHVPKLIFFARVDYCNLLLAEKVIGTISLANIESLQQKFQYLRFDVLNLET